MAKFRPNQEPFPVVFVERPTDRGHPTQMGLLHVASLAEVPSLGDETFFPTVTVKRMRYVSRRSIHYKKAEPNEPAVIDFVEVTLSRYCARG